MASYGRFYRVILGLHRIHIRSRFWHSALLLAGLVPATNSSLAEHTYCTKDDTIDIALPGGWRVDPNGIGETLAIFYPDQSSYRLGVSPVYSTDYSTGHLGIDAPIEQRVAFFVKRMRISPFQIIDTQQKKRQPERLYRSDDDALTLEVPLQWTVEGTYRGPDRFVLIGPLDRGIANVVAVSRWDRNGRSLSEFVRRYLKDSENNTVIESGNSKDKDIRLLIFPKVGYPPATQRHRHLYNHDAYVLEFRLNRFTVNLGERSSSSIFSPPAAPDRRDIRVMQTFVAVGDYVYLFTFDSFKESYQLYLPVVEKMLQSVRWR